MAHTYKDITLRPTRTYEIRQRHDGSYVMYRLYIRQAIPHKGHPIMLGRQWISVITFTLPSKEFLREVRSA